MRPIVLLSSIVLTVSLGVAAFCQGGWKEFKSEEGGFSCLMPAPPNHTTNNVQTKVGEIVVHLFTSVDRNESAYIAGYSDYPADLVAQSDPQKLLDGARDGAVRNSKGSLVRQRKMKIGTHPGVEFVVNVPGDFVLKQRIYLVKSRLYQAVVVTKKSLAGSADVNRFLDSLKVMPR